MDDSDDARVELYWIPLGAGGHSVRFNGRVYEALMAVWQHRSRSDLYHAALVIDVDGVRYTVEVAPSPTAEMASRGVVATGPVGSRYLGGLRLFRYEVRCWPGGSIPDLAEAVESPAVVTTDPHAARRILDVIRNVPTPVWGRDELRAGDMWNSNSVAAWSLATAGVQVSELPLPAHGRAPGWGAGLVVAARQAAGLPAGAAQHDPVKA
jgi:hypothetical protein